MLRTAMRTVVAGLLVVEGDVRAVQFDGADTARWHSGDDGVRLDIVVDDRPGTNDCVVTDRDTHQDGGIGTDEDRVAD